MLSCGFICRKITVKLADIGGITSNMLVFANDPEKVPENQYCMQYSRNSTNCNVVFHIEILPNELTKLYFPGKYFDTYSLIQQPIHLCPNIN